MNHESFVRYPAALALFGLVAGILFAPAAPRPVATAIAFGTVAVLFCFLRTPHRRDAVVFFLFVCAGILRIALVSDPAPPKIDPSRFSTVEARVGRGWDEVNGRRLLTAPQFVLVSPSGRVTIPERLRIYSEEIPGDGGPAELIRAEGFLRKTPAGWSMSVKSAQLIAYSGVVSRFDPAYWNRAIALALDSTAGDFVRARRGSALAKALLLGKSRQLPFDILDSYQRGGTYHLLVFSGLQIAAAAAAMRWSLGNLQRPRIVDSSLIAFCAIAPAFVGNEPSVSRAAWMIGLYSLSRMQSRPTDVGNLLFVSALLRAAVIPSELHEAGFLLTYAATGGLILLGRSFASFAASHRIPPVFAYGIAAEIATAPLSLLFFHRLTIGGSIATIIVTPLLMTAFALSIGASALLPISTEASFALLELIDRVNTGMMAVNGISARHLTVLAPAPQIALVVLCMTAAAVVAAFRFRASPVVAAALLVLASSGSFFVLMTSRSAPAPELHVIDVGQGDAILFRESRHAILVDGGGRSDDPAFARRVLFPKLLDRGVRSLDVVALSHPHPDHCGGLSGVLRELPVGELWISRRHLTTPCGKSLTEEAIAHGVTIRFVEYTPGRRIGSTGLEIHASRLRYKRAQENNSSIVYRVTAGGRRILLTGDIEKEAERTLVWDEIDLHADILKVPHHGSRSSSTDTLLDAVSPRIAAISCGVDNMFGHPHQEVLDALAGRRIRVLRTDVNGTVSCTIAGHHIFVSPEIDTSR